MNIPETLINFRLYDEQGDNYGAADIELPKIEGVTATITGAGIAGEMDTPILGHYKDMEIKVNYRVITKHSLQLSKQKAHFLDARHSLQVQDNTTGDIKTVPLRIIAKGLPKVIEMGKAAMGSAMESSVTLGIFYLKIMLDNKVMKEIDKFNFISSEEGEDYLKSVRSDLGL